MDDRALEWLHFLPADSQFVVDGAPGAFRDLLLHRCGPSGDSFLGWGCSASNLPDLTPYQSVVLVNPRHVKLAGLVAGGFGHIRSFAILPSMADARFMIPLDTPAVSLRGLNLAEPQRVRDSAKKVALLGLARMGLLHNVGDVLILARRSPSILETRLEELLGRSSLLLALKTGPPKVLRKTTIQVMDSRGEIIAFAKLATSAIARQMVTREASILKELAQCQEIKDSVPRLLGTMSLESAYLSLLAPGPSRRGPSSFGAEHRAFLTALAASTLRVMPFRQSEMARDLTEKLRLVQPHLSPLWWRRLTGAMDRLDTSLGDRLLPLSTAHRDFGPWNTRLDAQGRLFVFDWDGARAEMTPLYDMINFQFTGAVNASHGREPARIAHQIIGSSRQHAPELDGALIPYFFLAYVVGTALGRLVGALRRPELAADRILGPIADLLDRQDEWLPAILLPETGRLTTSAH